MKLSEKIKSMLLSEEPVSKLIDSLSKEAEQLEAMTQWQPIQSAPKDGAEILLFSMGDIGVCYFRDDRDFLGWTWGCDKEFRRPSHWMPLPKLPQAD